MIAILCLEILSRKNGVKTRIFCFQKQCLEGVNPDLFLGLMVSLKLAVTRRGGEGRIVNEGYIEKYNKFFIEYFDRIQLTKGLIRTDKINVLEMKIKFMIQF